MPIRLPPQNPGEKNVEIEPPTRLVVIGANGSGKTRLGIWLEEQNHRHMSVHRIGAQKALALPEYAPVKNLEQAEKELFLGRSDQHASIDRKVHDRWGGSPATHMLSDYERLLALLFARDSQRDRDHTRQTRESSNYIPVPDSPIDQIVALWGYLMPQRSISFADGKVLVGKGTEDEYHAREMSDGERVALYLLGQCLTAPSGAMVIIYEPEIHLHRALMDKLWNKVEELCPDKTFVYITHDLDFAASRIGAKKVWVQDYSKSKWTWVEVPADDDLPEQLVLEVIGSRKPLLFCEGERGGLDQTIYQLCYPEFHVVPRGSSDKVIEATKALSANASFHLISAKGVVDRDVKSEEEIEALRRQGIEVLDSAEIENVLCTEGLVAAVAHKLDLDVQEVVGCVTKLIGDALHEELDVQVAMRAARRIRYHLSCYSPTRAGSDGLQDGLQHLLDSLDMSAVIQEAKSAFDAAIATGRLDSLLSVYNRKSLIDRISQCFGLANGEYRTLLMRLFKGSDGASYLSILRERLPRFG